MISGFETSWCSVSKFAIDYFSTATCMAEPCAPCTPQPPLSGLEICWIEGTVHHYPHQNGVSLGKNLCCMNNDLSDVTFFLFFETAILGGNHKLFIWIENEFALLDRGTTLISELYHICPGPTMLSRTATSASSLTVLFTFSFSASNSATSAATL